MSQWTEVTTAPTESGLYIVHMPTADDASPLIMIAWYEPEGTGNMPGWQLYPKMFTITHWMPLPPPPEQDGVTAPSAD